LLGDDGRRPVFSEAKVLPRYVQSVADTKVTGKVTDAKGEPIPGVAVRVKGTNKGANTDVNGNFSFYNRQCSFSDFICWI
jgi:hypothetical protein